MIERGLYYATDEFSQMIRSVGGTWNDTKRRPIVCLIKSGENPNLYWAIPMGKLNHRNFFHQHITDVKLHLLEELNSNPPTISPPENPKPALPFF